MSKQNIINTAALMAVGMEKNVLVSPREAAEIEGYKKPADVDVFKNSKTFQKALAHTLPPEKIARLQECQTKAWKIERIEFNANRSNAEIKEICERLGLELVDVWDKVHTRDPEFVVLRIASVKFPNYDAIDRALDRIYKLIGAYAPEKIEVGSKEFEDLSDDELDEQIKLVEPQEKATIKEVKTS